MTLEELGHFLTAVLLQALAVHGWQPVVTTPLAGGLVAADGEDPEVGVLVILEKWGVELRETAPTTLEALSRLIPEVERHDGRRLVA